VSDLDPADFTAADEQQHNSTQGQPDSAAHTDAVAKVVRGSHLAALLQATARAVDENGRLIPGPVRARRAPARRTPAALAPISSWGAADNAAPQSVSGHKHELENAADAEPELVATVTEPAPSGFLLGGIVIEPQPAPEPEIPIYQPPAQAADAAYYGFFLGGRVVEAPVEMEPEPVAAVVAAPKEPQHPEPHPLTLAQLEQTVDGYYGVEPEQPEASAVEPEPVEQPEAAKEPEPHPLTLAQLDQAVDGYYAAEPQQPVTEAAAPAAHDEPVLDQAPAQPSSEGSPQTRAGLWAALARNCRLIARGVESFVMSLLAIGGVVCIVLAIAAFAFNYSLIMFKTGSMTPTIPQGSVALVHKMPASEVKVGDIVTIDREDARPVTHRAIKVEPQADGRTLIEMQGDANSNPDPQPYEVTTVRKVLWSAPGLAIWIVRASNPWVLGSITLAAAALVLWAFWPRKQEYQKLVPASEAQAETALVGAPDEHRGEGV
jgi:signal peptidase